NWSGRLAPRKHDAPMHAVDWFPTIARLAGYAPRVDLQWDGIDQWPALANDAETPAMQPERVIYIAMQGGAALRQGDWKLIQRNGKKPHLFNLAVDPYEKKN